MLHRLGADGRQVEQTGTCSSAPKPSAPQWPTYLPTLASSSADNALTRNQSRRSGDRHLIQESRGQMARRGRSQAPHGLQDETTGVRAHDFSSHPWLIPIHPGRETSWSSLDSSNYRARRVRSAVKIARSRAGTRANLC
jgi:hypothetical protein